MNECLHLEGCRDFKESGYVDWAGLQFRAMLAEMVSEHFF
jgi:hypothetical protein